MAARLDPEDVQTILCAYQQLAAEIVRNVDGHVAQYLGDGMLIYLGHPAAHEDDPARAVSAALEILSELPGLVAPLQAEVPEIRATDLSVRIGIHTGPVVVATIGAPDRQEKLALGSTVNLAARLSAAAAPDSVMISEATALRSSGEFLLEPLGPQNLKGLSNPVMAFRATTARGARSRISAWDKGSGRALIGRESLIARLEKDWSAVYAGQTRAVVLRGEAGIGKTRLVQALRQRIGTMPHGWLACHGAALHQASALYPVIEAMRASLDLNGDEAEFLAQARLAESCAALGIDDVATLQRLAAVLGLGPAGATQTIDDRRLTLEAIVHWCLQFAGQQPLVIVVEDIHWFDPSSLDLLALLRIRAGSAPLYVIGTIRPDAALPWPDVPVLDVASLGHSDIATIITEIIGDRHLTPQVQAALVARCDGVPLFAEEVAQAYLENLADGAAVMQVPSSLQDSMMARLDRLGSNKRLAQLGALLGRSFSHELIAAITGLDDAFLGPALAEIVSRGILHRSGVPPRASYAFRHALLQDAAADSILRKQFRRDHRHIGTILADRMSDADPMRIAHHFAQAGARPEATAWYRRAGSRAISRAEYREAETAYRGAIAMAEADETVGDVEALYGELARILQMTRGYAAPETVDATRRAVTRAGDTKAFTPHLKEERRLWQAMLTRGEHIAAGVRADQTLARCDAEPGNDDRLLFALGAKLQVAFFTGDLAGAEHYFARAAALESRISHQQPPGNTVSALGVAAMAAWWQGRPDTAHSRIESALSFASITGNPYDLAMALHYKSQVHLCEADTTNAAITGQRLFALADAEGFSYLAALAQGPICWASAHSGATTGNAAKARAFLQQQIDAGARIAIPTQLNRLAEIEMREGDRDAALATIDHALAFNPEESLYRPASLLLRAQFCAARPDLAEADLTEALSLINTMGARAVELPAATALAHLLHQRGDTAAAHACLAPVVRRTVGCNPRDHVAAASLLSQLTISC